MNSVAFWTTVAKMRGKSVVRGFAFEGVETTRPVLIFAV